MTETFLFDVSSGLALLGWTLFVVAVLTSGRSRERWLFVSGRVIPVALCGLYVGLLVTYWGTAPGGDFGSLDGVQRLFSVRGKLLAGWVHYLAFDLLVGRWIIDDVMARPRGRWLLVPSLPLTLMYGPAGLLLYLLLRRKLA